MFSLSNQQTRSHGTIMFKVIPITERPIHNQTMVNPTLYFICLFFPPLTDEPVLSQLYVRAMTDYNPQQDPSIPCADAGMSFRRGDVLEIVDQTDALWWQAKKLPSSSACAGLVPSTNLLRRSGSTPPAHVDHCTGFNTTNISVVL